MKTLNGLVYYVYVQTNEFLKFVDIVKADSEDKAKDLIIKKNSTLTSKRDKLEVYEKPLQNRVIEVEASYG